MQQLIAQIDADLLTQVGVGGVLALMILDRVFAFIHSRQKPSPTSQGLSPFEVKALLEGVRYLVKWHEAEDPVTGLARAYFPRAEWERMERNIRELKEILDSCKHQLERLSERD